MPRESFQHELDQLVTDILNLGTEVSASLETMVRAMETHDAALAAKELGVDLGFKARGAELERDSMILQARQAPVARDLRLLYTAQSLTNHLVRSGALTEHICQALVETADSERDEDLKPPFWRWPARRATSSTRASTSSGTGT
jgi:phosphate transport system protein